MVSFKTKTKLLSVVCIQIVSDDYLNFLSLVNHIAPNTPILGHLTLWSEQKLELIQKS